MIWSTGGKVSIVRPTRKLNFLQWNKKYPKIPSKAHNGKSKKIQACLKLKTQEKSNTWTMWNVSSSYLIFITSALPRIAIKSISSL